MPTIRVFNFRINVPANRLARTSLGGGLIVGGTLGFLPILGFWMIPAGLLILAVDSRGVRRWNRRATVWAVRRWNAYRNRSGSSPEA